jgi:hypothetical protein
MTSPTPPTDLSSLERHSRRSLWTVLALFLLVGAACLSPLGLTTWMPLVPIAIVVAVSWLTWSARSAGATPHTMERLLDDELRRRSLNLACRDALFIVMGLQPLLALVLARWSVAVPAAFMAASTALVGVVSLIASLLVRDR